MKKRIMCCLLALVLTALTACAAPDSKESGQVPLVQITVVCGKQPYAASELIQDETFRSGLEKDLGIRIAVEVARDIGPFDDAAEISFTGGLITDNCLWMIPMGSGYQLEKLNDMTGVLEPQFGRIGSTTYGYVFSDPHNAGTEPVLVADLNIIRETGIDRVPYTREGFHELLVALSAWCEVPLAVYGNPSGEGFGVLLGIFGLAPSGGREYVLEDGEIRFDKISDQAEAYLCYAAQLYTQGLISPDCVSMNEYACRNLFLSGKSALAMFPNMAAAQDTVALAREQGMDAVVVTIPAPEGKLETGIYNRPIGLISYDYPYSRELQEVYEALHSGILKMEQSDENLLPQYRMFIAETTQAPSDPVEELLPEILILYQKHLMDQTVIQPYYARLLTGSLPVEFFPEMKDEWLNPYAQVGEATPELSGANLMQIINGWYYKDQKDK